MAGRSTAVSARVMMATSTSSASSEARKLGTPSIDSRSASGERMMVSTIAVTSGRNTTEPIDSTNGKARNRPSATSTTSVESSRWCCPPEGAG